MLKQTEGLKKGQIDFEALINFVNDHERIKTEPRVFYYYDSVKQKYGPRHKPEAINRALNFLEQQKSWKQEITKINKLILDLEHPFDHLSPANAQASYDAVMRSIRSTINNYNQLEKKKVACA